MSYGKIMILLQKLVRDLFIVEKVRIDYHSISFLV